MATQAEKIAIVQSGVDHYAQAESGLMDVIKLIGTDLVKDWDDAYEADMIKQGHYLKIRNAHIQITGTLAGCLKELLELHEKGTAMAKANDADVALPSGYATGGGISVKGGGR